MNEFIHTLMKRRSIRRYLPDPIPQPLIEQMLTAAAWAPSAHNRQPWRFAVITQTKTKERLANAMGTKLRADLEADHTAATLIEREIGRSNRRITTAPLLIILCLTMADMDSYPDERRQQNERLMAVQSTAMAGQNLLLAAHTLSLGACWMCAPLFSPFVVRKTLHLPEDWQPQALFTIGYPAESRHKTRHPLDTLVSYLD